MEVAREVRGLPDGNCAVPGQVCPVFASGTDAQSPSAHTPTRPFTAIVASVTTAPRSVVFDRQIS